MLLFCIVLACLGFFDHGADDKVSNACLTGSYVWLLWANLEMQADLKGLRDEFHELRGR